MKGRITSEGLSIGGSKTRQGEPIEERECVSNE